MFTVSSVGVRVLRSVKLVAGVLVIGGLMTAAFWLIGETLFPPTGSPTSSAEVLLNASVAIALWLLSLPVSNGWQVLRKTKLMNPTPFTNKEALSFSSFLTAINQCRRGGESLCSSASWQALASPSTSTP